MIKNKPKKAKVIIRTAAIDLIKKSNGTIFSVDFQKLSGEPRTINGRLGVKKGVKGNANNPNVKELGYIRVYEQRKPNTDVRPGFKLVNARTINGLRINKQVYKVQ